eukprot:TRINITY_DN2224_c0_g1_i2.p1 TRINITY_DN2224_c0_g1~~TRINITY_DN2224_c0_g1_i2.p1  ORF type:complete len:712 (-),score=43.77 TRINITY_DN2224_c0_g1_i2:244-2379(-)
MFATNYGSNQGSVQPHVSYTLINPSNRLGRVVRLKSIIRNQQQSNVRVLTNHNTSDVLVQNVKEKQEIIPKQAKNNFNQTTADKFLDAQKDYPAQDFIKLVSDGPPRFTSPLIPGLSGGNLKSLPLMLYIPGLDGTGFGASRQFPSLLQNFDLKCMTVPISDRSSFTDLVATIKEYLIYEADDSSVSRPIYLLGESFGGLLAMAAAVECSDLVDRLIVANPASSYPRSAWPSIGPLLPLLPQEAYQQLPVILRPVLATFRNPGDMNVFELGQELTKIVRETAMSSSSLPSILPPETLAWKFKLLDEGCQFMENVGYKNIWQKTLIVTGAQDLLIPSREEGVRLERILPRAQNIQFPEIAHNILQNQDVDLAEIIKENNFYIMQRDMTSFPPHNRRQGNQFGKPGPIEIPNSQELQRDVSRLRFDVLQRIFSPVLFTTDVNGRVVQGLQNLPIGEQILFIGNHQSTPLDFSIIVAKILSERGVLVRALTHPVALQQNESNANSMTSIMAKYGAVSVSPSNLYKLLHLGESVMLLPGGATEALKSQKNKYKLMWSQQAEFVRMAARFGVTIIPFSSIGAEDGYQEVISSEQILNMPVVGDMLRRNTQTILQGRNPRAWQNKTDDIPPLVFPLVIPGIPQRFYIKMGRPIRTQKEWVSDRQKCNQVYQEIKSSVEDGIAYLLARRNEDPYKDFFSRLLYETSWNYEKQAPTFTP